jgi:hypothetical protein
MQKLEIEKFDIIETLDKRQWLVLSVYRPSGDIIRVDGQEMDNISPERTPIFFKDISRIVSKNTKKIREQEKLPPEMRKDVHKDLDTLEKVKDDVESRKTNKTSSAEAREMATPKGGRK